MNLNMYNFIKQHCCSFLVRLIPFGAVFILLNGCFGSNKPSSQVLAKVNNEEISIHQVNDAMSTLIFDNNESPQDLQDRALDKLIDQALLVEMAYSINLDRDQKVMRAVERARASVLAQAYLERILRPETITKEEALLFYDTHPELFSQRKMFDYQQINIQLKSENDKDRFRNKVIGAENMEQLITWLDTENFIFTTENLIKTSEQIPLEQLSKMVKMTPNEAIILNASNLTMLIFLNRIEAKPMSFAQAMPAIKSYEIKQKQLELAEQELARLRDKAEIIYFKGDETIATR